MRRDVSSQFWPASHHRRGNEQNGGAQAFSRLANLRGTLFGHKRILKFAIPKPSPLWAIKVIACSYILFQLWQARLLCLTMIPGCRDSINVLLGMLDCLGIQFLMSCHRKNVRRSCVTQKKSRGALKRAVSQRLVTDYFFKAKKKNRTTVNVVP